MYDSFYSISPLLYCPMLILKVLGFDVQYIKRHRSSFVSDKLSYLYMYFSAEAQTSGSFELYKAQSCLVVDLTPLNIIIAF